jgi:hypothetical protein
MNDFEQLAGQVFSTITDLMGEDAVWHSSKGDIKGNGLFKDPSQPVVIGKNEGYEYLPAEAAFEYYAGSFSGLKESVKERNEEYFTVRAKKYLVAEITSKFDGKTYVAHLNPKTEGYE